MLNPRQSCFSAISYHTQYTITNSDCHTHRSTSDASVLTARTEHASPTEDSLSRFNLMEIVSVDDIVAENTASNRVNSRYKNSPPRAPKNVPPVNTSVLNGVSRAPNSSVRDLLAAKWATRSRTPSGNVHPDGRPPCDIALGCGEDSLTEVSELRIPGTPILQVNSAEEL
jgi:hypothetical protein